MKSQIYHIGTDSHKTIIGLGLSSSCPLWGGYGALSSATITVSPDPAATRSQRHPFMASSWS